MKQTLHKERGSLLLKSSANEVVRSKRGEVSVQENKYNTKFSI